MPWPAGEPAAADRFAGALATLRQAGSFRYTSTANDVLTPRPNGSNDRRVPQKLTITMDGVVAGPDASRVRLQTALGPRIDTPVTIVQAQGKTFVQKAGQVTLASQGPAGDPTTTQLLGYLAAADGVRSLGSDTVGGQPVQRFGFTINPDRLGGYLRDQAVAEIQRAIGRPLGTSGVAAPSLKLTGTGELWVDDQGLPRREILDLSFPDASPTYAAQLHQVVDFSDLGQVAPLPAPYQTSDGSWQLPNETAVPPSIGPGAPIAYLAALASRWPDWLTGWLVAFGFLAAGLGLVLAARRRPGYRVLVIVAIASMVGGPLVQSFQLAGVVQAATSASGVGSLAQALGLAPGASGNGAPPAVSARPSPTPAGRGVTPKVGPLDATTRSAPPPIIPCGTGSAATDTDNEGLSDAVEACLGTSPYAADTAGSGISDYWKVRGFDVTDANGNPLHVTADPFAASSLNDGIPDVLKWPRTITDTVTGVVTSTGGLADSWDFNGNHVPNVWNPDIDGDNVPNYLDLSPFASTDYGKQFNFSIQGQSTQQDAYTYVEIQVQPQNLDHLRYVDTTLTWPWDYQGQITNNTNSAGTVRLVPALEILTNVSPNPTLIANYALQVTTLSPGNYQLVVPLQAFGDGSANYGFFGKVPYAPTDRSGPSGISWQASFVWLVEVNNNGPYNCTNPANPVSGGCQTSAQPTIAQVYSDRFRITGLNVTQSADYEVAAFAQPGVDFAGPSSALQIDKDLIDLAFVLNPLILQENRIPNQSQATVLDEVAHTLQANPNGFAPWGLANGMTAITQTYPHQDAGIADAGNLAADVLEPLAKLQAGPNQIPNAANCQDGAGDQFPCESAILAYQEQTGSLDLKDIQPTTAGGVITAAVNLQNVVIQTKRGVHLMMYEAMPSSTSASGLSWSSLDLAHTLEIVYQRYSGQNLTTALASVQAQYAALQASDVQTAVDTVYLALAAGRLATISADGQDLTLGTTPDVQDAISSAVSISDQSSNLAGLAGTITDIYNGTEEARQSGSGNAKATSAELSATDVAGAVKDYGVVPAFNAATTIEGIVSGICGVQPSGLCNADQLQIADRVMAGIGAASTAISLASTISEIVSAAREGTSLATSILDATAPDKLSIGLTILGWAIGEALNWTEFYFASTQAQNSIAYDVDLAQAIATTVWYSVLTLLSLIPGINLLVAVYFIVDGIWYAVTGDSNLSSMAISGLADFFLHDTFFVTVDSNSGFSTLSTPYTPPSLDPLDVSSGIMAGGRYDLSTTFRFTATLTNTTSVSELQSSIMQSAFSVALASSGSPATVTNTAYENCYLNAASTTITCVRPYASSIGLSQPSINLHLLLTTAVFPNVPYNHCILEVCSTDTYQGDDGYQPIQNNDIYLDVLPNSVDAFWTWSQITNPLVNAHWTSPYTIDTTPRLASGSSNLQSPLLADGLKWQLGLWSAGHQPTTEDTDQSGLGDGAEACHLDTVPSYLANGATVTNPTFGKVVGGWEVNLPDGTTAHVCVDPTTASNAAVGTSLAQLAANHASPYALYSQPRLDLTIAPVVGQPPGPTGVYVKPGDILSGDLTIQSSGVNPISSTLQICLPGFADNVQWTGLTNVANVNPATAGGCNGSGYQATFPNNRLDPGVTATAHFSSSVAPVNASQSEAVTLALPYAGQTVGASQTTTVDVDNPSVSLQAPTNGAFLNVKPNQSYTIAGQASDPTSFVSNVMVGSPVAPSVAVVPRAGALPIANGTTSFTQTWTIPGDGAYTLVAQATDAVGHQTTASPVAVTVDSTPPTVSLTLPVTLTVTAPDGTVLVRPGPDGVTIPLGGTASDPVVNGVSSGVKAVLISLDGQPWRAVSTAPAGTGVSWSFNWQLGGDLAGTHKVLLEAVDNANNTGFAPPQSVVVDNVPPSANLTTDYFGTSPLVAAGQPITVTGFANDLGNAPLPPRPVALTGGTASPITATSSATVWLEPAVVSDYGGVGETPAANVAWLGDSNGDGLADLAVGLPNANGDAGKVVLLTGQAGNLPVPPNQAEALANSPSQFTGAPGSHLGALIASAGAVDGSGRYSFLIGDPSNGRAFLVFGQPNAYGQNVALTAPIPGVATQLNAPGLFLVEPAGDVNGDGFDDLLVGANDTNGQPTLFLVLGHPPPWPRIVDVPTTAAAILSPFQPNQVAVGVGDTNGDHFGDFAVGDPSGSYGGGSAVYLFPGQAGYTAGARTALSIRASTVEKLGGSGTVGSQILPLGHFTGNAATSDFAYSTGTGATIVFQPSANAPLAQQALAASSYGASSFRFLAAPGDVNGDGRSDLLLGTGNGNALLILGAPSFSASPPVQATLTGVAAAASAPYALGGDLNCDGSSDLLLVPTSVGTGTNATGQVRFGPVPHVAPADLPRSPVAGASPAAALREAFAAAPATAGPTTILYVDPDYCATCANDGHTWGQTAFASVAAALAAVSSSAAASTEILLQPGVYPPFAVQGSSLSGLTVAGTDPDAVFIDPSATGASSQYGIQLQGSSATNPLDSVTLKNLTIRNAADGVQLKATGVNGETTASQMTRLSHLAVYSATYPLHLLDHLSTAAISQSTLVAPGTTAVIQVDGSADQRYIPQWNYQFAPPSPPGLGGCCAGVAASGTTLDLLAGDSHGDFVQYNPNSNAWATLPALLDPSNGHGLCSDPNLAPCSNLASDPSTGDVYVLGRLQGTSIGVNGEVRALAADSTHAYVGGSFTQAAAPVGTVSASNLAIWNPTSVTWSPVDGGVSCPSTGTDCVTALAVSNDGHRLYVGGAFNKVFDANGATHNATGFAVFDLVNQLWLAEPNFSGGAGTVLAITVVADTGASSGEDVFLGGTFSTAVSDVSSGTFADLVRYDNSHTRFLSIGGSQSWAVPSGTTEVDALAVSAAGYLYVGLSGTVTDCQNSGGCAAAYRLTKTTNANGNAYPSPATWLGSPVETDNAPASRIDLIAPLNDQGINLSQAQVIFGGAFGQVSYPDFFQQTGPLTTYLANLAMYQYNATLDNEGNTSTSWFAYGGDGVPRFFGNSWGPNSNTTVHPAGTDGEVFAGRLVGSALYLTGDFTTVYYCTGSGTSSDTCPSSPSSTLPPNSQTVSGVVDWTTRSGQTLPNQLSTGLSGGFALGDTLAINPGGLLYVGGNFGSAGSTGAQNVATWNTGALAWQNTYVSSAAFGFNPSQNLWSALGTLPFTVNSGAALAVVSPGSLLAFPGGTTSVYQYAVGSWSAFPQLPVSAGIGTSVGVVNGTPYVMPGGNPSNLWTTVLIGGSPHWATIANSTPPFSGQIGAGAGLAWDGGSYLYATQGNGKNGFARFNLGSFAWDPGSTLPITNFHSANGPAGLALLGTNLYTIDSPSTHLQRFGPVNAPDPVKLTLNQSALVGTNSAASYLWTNLTGQLADFAIGGAQNGQVGGLTWGPTGFGTPLGTFFTSTLANAQFLDYQNDVYRIGSASSLANGSVGYYQFHPDAYVSPGYCAPSAQHSCANDGHSWGVTGFNSIGAAIASGAQHVYVYPGQYGEAINLVNGIQVLGSGADLTVLSPPAGGSGGYLVSAQGVADAQLSLLTLTGAGATGGWNGLRAMTGAHNLTAFRDIVRNTATAFAVSGPGTNLVAQNDDIVSNGSGLVATGNACFGVSNTVFANQTGPAVSYNRSACPTGLQGYDDYYQNGPDISDGTSNPQPGPGDLFVDPAFTNAALADFRPLAGSPLVGAGNPSDPRPPGATAPVDIGYVQSAQASVYVSGSYCSGAGCVNDGLVWGVSAFSDLPSALTQATKEVAALGCVTSTCGTQLTVAVGIGTYPTTQPILVPSHVNLTGSGADLTTLQATSTGSVLVIDGATGVGVSGFTLTGGTSNGTSDPGAGIIIRNLANNVQISHNLIVRNNLGVAVQSAASAQLSFDTVASNAGDGVQATGQNSLANVADSILASNGTGGSGYGLDGPSPAQALSQHNLYAANASGPTQSQTLGVGDSQVISANIVFADLAHGNYHLTLASPAVDAADPTAPVPVGGGPQADLGYSELTAAPLLLLLGTLGNSCALGNAGVGAVQVGFAPATPGQPISATLPTLWQNAILATPGNTTSYFTTTVAATTAGLYRLYVRAADVLGNQLSDPIRWFVGTFGVSGGPPQVAWLPLPPTTTTAAAVQLTVRASETDPASGQTLRNFGSAVFCVDGTTQSGAGCTGGVLWPASQVTDPKDGLPDWQTWVPLSLGSHTITAYAVDPSGVTGASPAEPIAVTGTSDVATITTPADGGAVGSTSLVVSGYARFRNLYQQTVSVAVDGGSPVPATVANPGALLSAWSATVSVIQPGSSHTLSATAGSSTTPGVRGADPAPGVQAVVASDSSTTDTQPVTPDTAGPSNGFVVDTTPPTVSFTPPTSVVSGTVTLAGTAGDVGSGVASVQLSFDGGQTFVPAMMASGAWSLSWTPAAGQDGVTQALQVQATDNAGNLTTQSFSFAVDDVAPAAVPVTFTTADHSAGLPVGTFLGAPENLSLSWPTPTDGGGAVVVAASVDQLSGAVPSQPVSGTGLTANLSQGGAWYAHLKLSDPAGNSAVEQFGPWYVDNVAGASCSTRQETILVDGNLDLADGEWGASTLLDDDQRTSGRTESLYAAWDASALYLAWNGASWSADGTLWLYVDVGSGGTTAPVSALPSGTLPPGGLPLNATYAVNVLGPTSATLFQWTGAAWQPTSGLGFAEVGSSTELRLPWTLSSVGALRLLAFAQNPAGQPWSVFPTTNPLSGPWNAAYVWPSPCAVTVASAGQPQTRAVSLNLTSQPGPGVPLGPGSPVTYTVAIANADLRDLTGSQLQVSASSGLGYQGASGCPGCNLGESGGTLSLPTIPSGSTLTLTLTGQLVNPLSGQSEVTTTLALLDSAVSATPLAQTALANAADSQPPTVALAAGLILAPGNQTVTGTASDGNGIGVGQVQIRLGSNGNWIAANGTQGWSAPISVPAGGSSVDLQVQATDRYGQVSPILDTTVPVVETGPSVSFNLPSTAAGNTLSIDGTIVPVTFSTSATSRKVPGPSSPVALPGPAHSSLATGPTTVLASAVQAQIDGSGPWLPALGPYAPDTNGVQHWHFDWALPAENGTTHSIAVRAVDVAGNVGPVTTEQSVVAATAVGVALSLSADTGGQPASPGGPITYTLTLTNAGPNLASGVVVTDTFPSGLDGLSWTCAVVANTGSSCGSPTNGSGPIAATISVGVNGGVTFVANATIDQNAASPLVNQAFASVPGGQPNAGGNALSQSISTTANGATATPTTTITPTTSPTTTPGSGTPSATATPVTYKVYLPYSSTLREPAPSPLATPCVPAIMQPGGCI
jgi:uncharacterized repeat protein (TIGR01451 family)